MSILTYPPAHTDGALALVVLPLDAADGRLARLVERDGRPPTLLIDPAAERDDQLVALEEAARYLRTGEMPTHARKLRHLSVVRPAVTS